jgi:hypothetical protein
MLNFSKLINSFESFTGSQDSMIELDFDHRIVTVASTNGINNIPILITWPYEEYSNIQFHSNLLTATTFFLKGAIKGSCEQVPSAMSALLKMLGNKLVQKAEEIAELNSISLIVHLENSEGLLSRLVYLDFLLMLDKKFGLILDVPFVDEAVKRDAYLNLVDNLLEIVSLDGSLIENFPECIFLIRESIFNPLTAVIASFQITYPRLPFYEVWKKVSEIGDKKLRQESISFEDKTISQMKLALKDSKLTKKKCNLSWIWKQVSIIFSRFRPKKALKNSKMH